MYKETQMVVWLGSMYRFTPRRPFLHVAPTNLIFIFLSSQVHIYIYHSYKVDQLWLLSPVYHLV